MALEKVKARDVGIGDRISLDGLTQPAFTVVAVEHGHRIAGFIKAVQIQVRNDGGQRYSQRFGVRRPVQREVPD